MKLRQRAGARFVLEALAIIVAAVIGGALHLDWWQIALLVLVVFLLAFWVESWLGRPEPEPIPPPPPVPAAPHGGPWNVWELERMLRESGEQDEEKTFLLHYLREYAGADGTLPPEFDDLVRESFGSLLGAAT